MNQFFFVKIEKLFAKFDFKISFFTIKCHFSKFSEYDHVAYRQNRIDETNAKLVQFFQSANWFSRNVIFSVFFLPKTLKCVKYGLKIEYLENELTDQKKGTSSLFVSPMRF